MFALSSVMGIKEEKLGPSSSESGELFPKNIFFGIYNPGKPPKRDKLILDIQTFKGLELPLGVVKCFKDKK